MELAIYLIVILFFILKFVIIGSLIFLALRVLSAIFGSRDNSVNININISQPEKPYTGPPPPFISPLSPDWPPKPEPRRSRDPDPVLIGPPTIDHVPHRTWLPRRR